MKTQTCLNVLTSSKIVNSSEISKNPYASWFVEYDSSIIRVSLSQPILEDYNAGVPFTSTKYDNTMFVVDFEAEVGQKLFVLYIKYAQGDSFGQASGEIEPIWVFYDQETAQLALDALHEQIGKSFFKFKDERLKRLHVPNVLMDHMSDFEDLELTTLSLTE